MLFYKAEGVITNCGEKSEEAIKKQKENARKLSLKTDEFNNKDLSDSFFFTADSSGEVLTVGIIAESEYKVNQELNSYLDYIGYSLKDISVKEITTRAIKELLSDAQCMNYTDAYDEAVKKFSLDIAEEMEFGENIIEDKTKSELISEIKKNLLCESFMPELKRIYRASAKEKPFGHPVHYIVQSDDGSLSCKAYKLLLQALYANKRLNSRRYSYINFKPGQRFSPADYETLYKNSVGGTVVVRYFAQSISYKVGSDYESETIEKLCKTANKYCNMVLTVFCLPALCESAKALFYEYSNRMSFVELHEDLVYSKKAIEFLKMIAKEYGIRADKNLIQNIEEGRGYQLSELQDIFDSWYSYKLKSTYYPQYKYLGAADKPKITEAPKCSAYDELENMIGLGSAKEVIRKALNYYKMQKLYEQNGIKKDTPAMHMVFSGNPGTAKTTAARLFARIMRDNGVLASGQLVEVGRGDLVGKYVGWTAQTVQAKFKSAVGGVLFIDEAYSLVDNTSGSFGDEAINTIVQEMENHRDDVVVIFAGYPDKMEEFLRKNPGLRSRIAFHVPFNDYSIDELCKIAEQIAKNKGVSLAEDALGKLTSIFAQALKHSDFGNGRYVRNVIESAKMNLASRILEYAPESISQKEITTIKAEDISMPEIQAEEKRTIGFALCES